MEARWNVTRFGALCAGVTLWLVHATSLAQQPPADAGGQNAAQAMQGGGMTQEGQLDDALARRHFRAATTLYDEGRFLDAAREFERAYELSRRPELLYNAYIAYREANERAQAARMLESYLNEVPDAPDRVNLSARLEELRRAVAQQEQRERDLADAELRARREEVARRNAEAEADAWPWVILGVGAAALIAGGIVGAVAHDKSTSLRDDCAVGDSMGMANLCGGVLPLDLEARRSDAFVFANTADGLLFGGGAVAIAGLVLSLIYGLPGTVEPLPEAPTASVACGPTGCAANLGARF